MSYQKKASVGMATTKNLDRGVAFSVAYDLNVKIAWYVVFTNTEKQLF